MKAIETQYKGYRFRSRIEARWAIFFDTLRIRWEYEKEGFTFSSGIKYLPDFYLPEYEYWIEIKGTTPMDDEEIKARRLCESTKKKVFIFFGEIGNQVFEYFWANDGAYIYAPGPVYEDDPWGGGVYWDNFQLWCECPICKKLGIRFEGRAARLCDCVKGDKGCNYASELLINAYTNARSARFEHGEQYASNTPIRV